MIPISKIQHVLYRIVVIKRRIRNELALFGVKVVGEDVASGTDKCRFLCSAKQSQIIAILGDINVQEKPLKFFSLMMFQEVQALRSEDDLSERSIAVDFELICPIGSVICIGILSLGIQKWYIQKGHVSIGLVNSNTIFTSIFFVKCYQVAFIPLGSNGNFVGYRSNFPLVHNRDFNRNRCRLRICFAGYSFGLRSSLLNSTVFVLGYHTAFIFPSCFSSTATAAPQKDAQHQDSAQDFRAFHFFTSSFLFFQSSFECSVFAFSHTTA